MKKSTKKSGSQPKTQKPRPLPPGTYHAHINNAGKLVLHGIAKRDIPFGKPLSAADWQPLGTQDFKPVGKPAMLATHRDGDWTVTSGMVSVMRGKKPTLREQLATAQRERQDFLNDARANDREARNLEAQNLKLQGIVDIQLRIIDNLSKKLADV